ncbi:Flagellar basal body rod protein FlgB [Fundidesulfovibrio magnetotacticus]|uniref:Flagellar basal body rod protein FlgB n=1 Tax=Fundidesulfovibrio magnetotacticus TaxID=2730080 RepID=A0A6V8LZT7_9BACT|nr:flagellar basal body rod protein FlgB [Fundidesulfovibrio magnetotacticus]GFK93745.1 Flagellar basal body rod protein FlgB [Fundidesulfovibrio magnetotacticus]
MPDIYGANTDLIAKVMDLRIERQNLVMSNLANMNIPGYKARSIDFEGALQDAVGTQEMKTAVTRTNAAHVPGPYDVNGYQADVVKEFKPRTIYGADAVDLDKEMAAMAKNSLMYNSLTTVMQKGFEGIQKVIMDGGK